MGDQRIAFKGRKHKCVICVYVRVCACAWQGGVEGARLRVAGVHRKSFTYLLIILYGGNLRLANISEFFIPTFCHTN